MQIDIHTFSLIRNILIFQYWADTSLRHRIQTESAGFFSYCKISLLEFLPRKQKSGGAWNHSKPYSGTETGPRNIYTTLV
jgi:hypothetical protein